MFHYPYLIQLSPLYVLQAVMTIWMLVDSTRRSVESWWFWVILVLQPFGPWAYFFTHKVKDFRGGWWRNLFQRRIPLTELRHQVERSPTAANRLELGVRLVEEGMYDEGLP